MEYKGRNVCPKCHRAYAKWIDVCPKCKTSIKDNKIDSRNFFLLGYEINRVGKIVDKRIEQFEGERRKHFAGGLACNYCPHCFGNKDWCPFMD